MSKLGRYEPFVVFIWGLVVNLLIANGYLLPAQHDMWVNGGLELISALGSVSLITLAFHHSLLKRNQQQSNQQLQTLLNSIAEQKTTTIPIQNPQNATVHVNI